MTLDSMVQDASSGLFVPPQARRPVIPWDDLQALSTPTANAQISPDLISALAVLIAQGKDRPRLLSSDAQGRLVTVATPNNLAKLSANFTGGSTVIQVDDNTGFYPGQVVALASATGGPASCGGMSIKSLPDNTHVNVVSSCAGQNFVVGDFLIGRGTVTIDTTATQFDVSDRAGRLVGHVTVDNIANTVDVSDRSGRLVGHVNVDNFPLSFGMATLGSVGFYGHSSSGGQQITASVDNNGQVHANVRATADPPTSSGGFNFAPGVTPSLAIPAISGLTIDLLSWSSTIANVSGAAAATAFVKVDSTGAGGFTQWAEHLGVPNVVGSVQRSPNVPARIVAAPGQGITIHWDIAVPAGYGGDISVCYTYK